ncbi:hypothetical protein GMOD_00002384 [Pyrenophora seminiperda CCB06]|uniref:Ubiquitin 3 binding protein But2 C-terminal domain-containing protein n=1 Tax=Pyrenophora seminiperda CCB06 TaxID=1302712 RepID=A0A3M7LXT2_9PLEO|nr:hypothetical protein GMOD_00002384 [Pyrenophora seminiperda CCB06]
MLANTAVLICALVLGHASSAPYPLSNSTAPPNITACTPKPILTEENSKVTDPSPSFISEFICHSVYPIDLTVVNSRYPTYDIDHLHRSHDFFMLRRQVKDQGEIATQVQFENLPAKTSNLTCRLEFVLPRVDLQLLSGPNPSFNVYQVERETNAIATWITYENDKSSLFFGTVNGQQEALERTRSVGGVAAINSTACNETMSFTMGMMYDSPEPNYWQFNNLPPPAFPVQGFRMVYGC